MTHFAEFFEALWGRDPFPWQTMLAERATTGDWPEVINLPTASGKTACLDSAIFALANTTDLLPEQRMPRRIWFVVDRRIVVDEAFERAANICKKLAEATGGPMVEISDRLRSLSGTERPLAVARLRGGTWRSNVWARLPTQPTIICSTVDQVGSALLFRSFGHGDRTASIYAALVAHDSLILLDEAHCAVPFMQTLQAVARYRSNAWAPEPVKTPFRFSVMSATPPVGIAEERTFPKPAERQTALKHPLLHKRFTAHKPATLAKPVKDNAEFIYVAAEAANAFRAAGKLRIAVMVNRVATAENIAEYLRSNVEKAAEIVLLTGRLRPLDRDTLVDRWEPVLKAGSTQTPTKPTILVTTQCLEVGADFSFDALVTECASLDALRQRFGRLDRLGALGESPAVILIREQDTKEPKDEDADPIYGKARFETWKWLNEQRQADGTVDFGIEALDACVSRLRAAGKEQFNSLLAPTPNAPILLPAHLDLLCQTSPRTTPEPDIALFLHGKGRGEPEARVVLRTDLPDSAGLPGAKDLWMDILSLIPPTSPEMFTVPLYRLRRWLTEDERKDSGGDVEGSRQEPSEGKSGSQKSGFQESARFAFLLWRGEDRSELTNNPRHIAPDDIVVLRIADALSGGLIGQKLQGLGQSIDAPDGLGAERLDLAEPALRRARARVVLRLHSEVLRPLCANSSVASLVDLATTAEVDREEIKAGLQSFLEENASTGQAAANWGLPQWFKEAIANLLEDGFRIDQHPGGGLILTGYEERREDAETEDDPFADEEDFTSKRHEPVTLRQHTADFRLAATDFATRCLGREFSRTIAAAAEFHDLGKLDRRFQLLLRDGDELAVASEEPLAKSAVLPEGRRRRNQDREDARLPKGFRHEFLSMQVAERFGSAPDQEATRDLALHLIASHHGYARPFAPIVPDRLEAGKDDLELNNVGIDARLTVTERERIPPYRLDSDVPDRFWRLTRRHGWWGLAYFEAIFRLADWQASRKPQQAQERLRVSTQMHRGLFEPRHALPLDALDGANPLAFLAALGTLRLLTRVFPEHDLRLSWTQRLGAWRPLLWAARALDKENVVTALHEGGLRLDVMLSPQLLAASEAAGPKNKKGESAWKDKLKFPVHAFRDYCSVASAVPSPSAEYAATWAGEMAVMGDDGEELARRTRFDFTAGQQAFIGMLRELRNSCTPADLRRSLFTGWHYSAMATSMRWDPQDEKRQYALQAVDPTDSSKNPPVAEMGANFLAVEGLPLFPLAPDTLASQPGFNGPPDGRRWCWPIWICSLGLDAIRSLLTLALGDVEQWPATRRRDLGVAVVFQSGIVQPSGRYRCFTPAGSL